MINLKFMAAGDMEGAEKHSQTTIRTNIMPTIQWGILPQNEMNNDFKALYGENYLFSNARRLISNMTE